MGSFTALAMGMGVYTINTQNAQATFVNSLTVSLAGTSFGCDFNPAADRLRIISDTGQNLRHNVNAGGVTIDDGTLNYLPVPPATTPTTALGVTGAAYTNNDLDPNTATTLFDIDSTLDQVVIQSPPNNGTLVPTGKLGRDTDSQVGFDIASRLVKGVTRENRAFASLVVNGKYGFYGINLLTGQASFLGRLSNDVIDIAVSLSSSLQARGHWLKSRGRPCTGGASPSSLPQPPVPRSSPWATLAALPSPRRRGCWGGRCRRGGAKSALNFLHLIPNYGERYRNGEAIATGFVESTVNRQ